MRAFLLLALLALPCHAQQDNSTNGSITMNFGDYGQVSVKDAAGNLVTVTVAPDTMGPVKVDALLSCQAAVNAIEPVLLTVITQFNTNPNLQSWIVPMKAAKVLLDNVQSKLLVLYPPALPVAPP